MWMGGKSFGLGQEGQRRCKAAPTAGGPQTVCASSRPPKGARGGRKISAAPRQSSHDHRPQDEGTILSHPLLWRAASLPSHLVAFSLPPQQAFLPSLVLFAWAGTCEKARRLHAGKTSYHGRRQRHGHDARVATVAGRPHGRGRGGHGVSHGSCAAAARGGAGGGGGGRLVAPTFPQETGQEGVRIVD